MVASTITITCRSGKEEERTYVITTIGFAYEHDGSQGVEVEMEGQFQS